MITELPRCRERWILPEQNMRKVEQKINSERLNNSRGVKMPGNILGEGEMRIYQDVT